MTHLHRTDGQYVPFEGEHVPDGKELVGLWWLVADARPCKGG